MYNKMFFGVLTTMIGLVVSAFSFIYAALNPWIWKGHCYCVSNNKK